MKEGLPGVPTKAEWLERNLETGSVVGVDPFLMPCTQFSTLKASLDRVGMRLVAVEKNLVDIVWGKAQPRYPDTPIRPLEMQFCGKSWEEKVYVVWHWGLFLKDDLCSLYLCLNCLSVDP